VVDKKCRMVEELPFCMSCGDCLAICPENAIELAQFIQFKRFFRYLDRGEPEWPRRF
jgi:ferredoxin